MLDRGGLTARITEVECLPSSEATVAELDALYLLSEMFYWADEGFVEIEPDGRCYPTSVPVSTSPDSR